MWWFLVASATLTPVSGLPFAPAAPEALAPGTVALAGAESLAATAHAGGESLAWTYRSREEWALEVREETRWRYLLRTDDGAWTWESPEGDPRGAVRLASGDTVDLLVEDLAVGRFRWTAIDRAARRVLAEGVAEGDRGGDVVAHADTFVLGTARGLERLDPRTRTWTLLLDAPGACLRADTGAHLWWVAGGSLRRGTLDGDELRGLRDVPWADPDVGLAPCQQVAVVPDGEGWAVVYEVVRAPGAPARQGVHLQRYDAALAPLGGPVQLAGDVARAKDAPLGRAAARGRWTLAEVDGARLLARVPDGRERDGEPRVTDLPQAPGWARVDLGSTTDLAVTARGGEATVWLAGLEPGRPLRRVPVGGLAAAAAARPDATVAPSAIAAARAVLALPRVAEAAVRDALAAAAAPAAAAGAAVGGVDVGVYVPDAERPVETATVTLRAGARCVARAAVQAALGPGTLIDRAPPDATKVVERVVSYAYPGAPVREGPREVWRAVWAFDPGDDCLRRVELRHVAPLPAR